MAADAGRPLRAGEFAAAAGLPHGEGEGRGAAVEAEAAGRAGLAGPGPRRAVHAARSRRENTETRTVTGSSSLSSKVLPHPDLKEEEPSMAAYCRSSRLMIRSRHPKAMFDRAGRRARRPRRGRDDGLRAWRSSWTSGAGRCCCSCCRTTTTCGDMREEQQAREHPAPVTAPDGITRTRLETGHGRALATLFGTVQVTRCAWRKPGAAELVPGGRGPVAAGRAALPFPGDTGRARGRPRVLRRRARRDHPPLRPGDRKTAARGVRRACRRRHPRLLRRPDPAAVHAAGCC